MSTTDELARLAELHRSGALSEEEFARAKARVLQEGAPAAEGVPIVNAVNRLRRSTADGWLGGVCAGIARLTGMDAWIWRLATVLLSLWGGSGVLIYVLLWIFVPRDPGPLADPRRAGTP